MSQIDNIVNVSITRQTSQIDIRSFDIPLLLVKSDDESLSRVGVYTSADGVAEDFGVDSVAHNKAKKIFGQDVRPREIRVGVVRDGETYTEALHEVRLEDDTWYILTTDSHEKEDILALAETIQAMEKLYFASYSGDDALSNDTEDDVAPLLKDAGFFRTVVVFSENSDEQFPEDAWVGGQISKVVGSYTWEYKQLAGVTVSKNLTDSQISTLEEKGYNYYIRVKGASIMRRGKTVEGEWIDVIQTQDWIKARMQEQIFYRLVNLDKLPYTNSGVAMVQAEMHQVLTIGQNNGAIDTFSIQAPNVYDIPEMIRATRELGDFKFEARLQGAVSTVVIRGTLTV